MQIKIQLVSDDGRIVLPATAETAEVAKMYLREMENKMNDEEVLHEYGECDPMFCRYCKEDAESRAYDHAENLITGN